MVPWLIEKIKFGEGVTRTKPSHVSEANVGDEGFQVSREGIHALAAVKVRLGLPCKERLGGLQVAVGKPQLFQLASVHPKQYDVLQHVLPDGDGHQGCVLHSRIHAVL